MAVVASQSPDAGGEVRPKRPTGGKAASGRACSGLTHERDFVLTNRVTTPPWHCCRGSRKLCLRNRMRALRTDGSVGGRMGNHRLYPAWVGLALGYGVPFAI